ncbi:FAD-dependent oxidoreductase [Rhizomonospora bruguierae]|uniref:FAD-dependent oxidoreductase n=1 Tax=Rhizomonospora bruguierae TaxID=1581705 RepID=UPI001BCAB6C4|nr:FAD-dependent oxidoreductase [Micromonospora sp. NBRC 107566]
MTRVVVVGAGPAAHRFVECLHRRGHRDPVVMLGAERRPPYNRMLLASVLAGALPAEAVTLPDLPAGVEAYRSATVTSIDRATRTVHLDDGRRFRYDALVLATGARAVVPRVPGIRWRGGLSPQVRPLRTLDSCVALGPGPVCVLGGGVLGVEAALALRRAGHRVTLVHRHPYPVNRHLDAAAGTLLARHLADRGVDVRLEREAVRYDEGLLVLRDGETVAANTLLLCAGARPRVELARAAGLAVAGGIVVDDRLRTDDPHVYAIGDCARYGRESGGGVARAWAQAETLAALLTGGRRRYEPVPAVVRLRDPELSVVALDRPRPRAADGRAETVTFTDPAGRRHAALEVLAGRIVRGVLYGLPQATAAATQLFDRDLPLPADRLALLLGTPPRTGTGDLPDDAVVCFCNTVTRAGIVAAWRRGCRDRAALGEATRAGTGCGTCVAEVDRICERLGAEPARGPATETGRLLAVGSGVTP